MTPRKPSAALHSHNQTPTLPTTQGSRTSPAEKPQSDADPDYAEDDDAIVDTGYCGDNAATT